MGVRNMAKRPMAREWSKSNHGGLAGRGATEKARVAVGNFAFNGERLGNWHGSRNPEVWGGGKARGRDKTGC